MLFSALLSLMGGCSQAEDVPATGADDVLLNLSLSTRGGNLPQEGMEIGEGVPEDMHLWIYGADANDNLKSLAYIHKDKDIFTGRDLYGNPVETIRGLRITNGKLFAKLHFYLVLNSRSVNWTSENVNLDGNTSLETLKELAFTGIVSGKEDNQLLMYGETEVEITAAGNYEVQIPATRAVAKMELFFTRRYAESELTIQSIDLLPVVKQGYLVPGTLTENDYVKPAASKSLLQQETGIATTSSADYGDFSGDEANFTKLSTSCLLENPLGLEGWNEGNVPDEKYPESKPDENDRYYKVRVHYIMDGDKKEREFYLPPIERNRLYKIYARIAPGDKPIRFQIEVKDWTDGGNGNVNEWEY